jgi:uncharacterized protein (DUF885 family)
MTGSWRLIIRCAAVVAGLGGMLALPASGLASERAGSADARYVALEREYVIYFLARYPVVATYLGGAALDPALARVDGTLRDQSAGALAAEDRMLARYRSRFLGLDPRQLSAPRRIDREVAVAQIQFLLREHGARHYQQRALDTYVDEPFRGIDWQLQGLDETGGGHYGTVDDWTRVIERLHAIPAYLARAEAQLAAGVHAGSTPDWRVLRGYGLESSAADREYFAVVLPRIANERIGGEHRDALLWELTPAAAHAADAYARFRAFILATFFADSSLEDDSAVKPPFRGERYAMGEAEYDWALRNNLHLTVTARQLYDQSLAVVARTRSAMAVLAREIAAAHHWSIPADDEGAVRTVFAELGRDAPRSDAEMVRWYRDTGARLVDFARRTGLFAVPADYRLDVTVTPPPLRTSIEGAAYYPAPPFKATGTGRFFVSPTGDDPAKLAENNRAALADLAAHEGFPGHDWHYKVMTEHRADIALVRWLTPGAVEDSSSMWEDSMAAEGWALYAEALMAEPAPGPPTGFYTPEERLYQLQGQLLRDLRVRLDTGLHTQHMNFDQAVDLMSLELDFLPGSCADPAALADAAKRASCDGARKAVFRYTRWPTQAITYRLGKEEIQALRAAAEQRLGPAFSAQKFHLELMKQGTIPAGYFGAELLATLAADAGLATGAGLAPELLKDSPKPNR